MVDIKRLENPMHGKSSVIKVVNNSGIFKELPNEFNVMRYQN